MRLSIPLVAFLATSVTCVFWFNRTEIENDPKIVNLTVEYTQDTTGQFIANATFVTFVTITKMLIYFKFNLPEDQNDRKFKKVLVSSVFEAEKVFQGMQSNSFIPALFSALRKSMAFEYRMPLLPVCDQ